ncbi:hypothetical protein [Methylocapsa palsarum]|uniref:hypothetical protein n=1 Tax=Methylocapsa palsarum TaxID=1612308 RepID=UPI00111349A4|nr:hypothetical protein [Methylocapsa palsarum]
MASALSERVERARSVFQEPIDLLNSDLKRAIWPRDAEAALEKCVARLRHRWLNVSSSSVNQSFRTPTAPKLIKTSTGQLISSGYERELQPVALETRCRSFFGSPPEGWTADHVVLSSGQAAMNAALHLVQSLDPRREGASLSFAHVGAYFETTELLDLFSSCIKVTARGWDAIDRGLADGPHCLVIEPVFFEDGFKKIELKDLIRKLGHAADKLRAVIFDDTLCGAPQHSGQDLRELTDLLLPVIRVNSGLKLFQGGFELANVGILTVYSPVSARLQASDIGAGVRKIRSLIGSGPTMAETAALEAPWFLSRPHTDRFQANVFANNALLASALAGKTKSFASIAHPTVDCGSGVSPFCVLTLKKSSGRTYENIEQTIGAEARLLDVLFEQGGSFGFRGHRYEVVRPEGKTPFLRVAVGSRVGWSLEGIIQLLRLI